MTKKMLTAEQQTAINWLERQRIVDILEVNAGIACYDNESTDELRETLRVNIEDGTLNPVVLEM